MTLTTNENIVPNDAIINTGKKTARVDFGIWTIATLRQEWNPKNTDSDTPQIEFSENIKGVDFRNNDWVVVWTMDETSEPVTITYGFTNDTLPVQIDCYTRGNRTHGQKVVAEVRRILENNKTDTIDDPEDGNISGRTWLTVDRVTHYGKTQRGYYRYIVDGELRWRMRQVSA